MINLILNQAYLFLLFTLEGIIVGLLFDFFRILRKAFKTSNFVTYIEDFLFWILTGFLILYSIFILNNGEIRLYMFIGIILGVTFYILLFSKQIIRINVYIINIIKTLIVKTLKIFIYPIEVILKLIRKIFIKPINFFVLNLKNVTKNTKKLLKKYKKRRNLQTKVE